MCTGLVQVDVNFRVSEVFVSACAVNNTLFALDDWLLGDQVNRPVLVDDLVGVCEAHISVVVLSISLKARSKQNVIQSNYNNNESIFLTWPVCVNSAPFSAPRNAPEACVAINLAFRQ